MTDSAGQLRLTRPEAAVEVRPAHRADDVGDANRIGAFDLRRTEVQAAAHLLEDEQLAAVARARNSYGRIVRRVFATREVS